MILKIINSKEDKQEEVFNITQYYTECEEYLEADITETGNREIIVGVDGDGYTDMNDFEEIIIYTDNMIEIWKMITVEAED